jgi:hypothetical protein
MYYLINTKKTIMKTLKYLLVFSLITTCNLGFAQNFEFRNSKWGIDSISVKKNEKSKLLHSQKGRLVYNGKLNDWDAKIMYSFTSQNQLFHSGYIIILENKDPQDYINAYVLLQETLTKKYNEAINKKSTTINGKIIGQDEWASNLVNDNLSLETSWKYDNTNIVLSLFNVNDAFYLEVNYTAAEADKKNNEDKKVQLIKDL